jgi:PhoH-like ATPase
MAKKTPSKKNLFVLDTNVHMHDPACIFRFKEHDIFTPMIVLEELDHNKKGLTEVARNTRQASRFIDELIKGVEHLAIEEGIPLSRLPGSGTLAKGCTGRLFFQTQALKLESLPEGTTTGLNDNTILKVVVALKKQFPDRKVVLVSKDINVRIKAATLGLHAEDYSHDEVVDDINLLYSGVSELPLDFWATHGKDMETWKKRDALGERTFYKISGPLVKDWYPNQFLYLPDDSSLEVIVRKIENGIATLEVARNFRTPGHNVWGIMAKNREQNFALNMLLDPEIDFVTLLGTAGTGKTLMALVAGLVQTIDKKLYTEIIMTRDTIPIGEDIGFLPGTEEEKMAPWMGALMDNLEMLGQHNGGKDGNKPTTEGSHGMDPLIMRRVKIRALNFMRGRTFLHRWLIIDEAQNLTAKQMKTLITRAGPGTKIICLGNLGQIDSPYLSATTSGLAYVVERFKQCTFSAHITLLRGERSRLADYATDNL